MRSLPIVVLAASAVYALQCPLLQGDAAADHIAQHISCPEGNHIRRCLRATRSVASDLDALIQCLRVTGCDYADNLITFCKTQELLDGGIENADLRRRQDDALTTGATGTDNAASTESAATTGDATGTTGTPKTAEDTATHKDKTQTKTDGKTTATASATAAQSTAETQSTAAATSATSAPSTLETQTSPSSSPMTTAPMSFAPDPNALVCLTTSFVSTSFCGIISVEGSPTTLPCVPTTTPSVSCAPGMLCQSASAAGAISCMKRQDSLTLSGLIVAIVFSSALAFCFGALIFFMCRSKRSRVRQERMLQAQAAMKMQDQGRRDAEALGIVGARGYSDGGGRGSRARGDEMGVPLMAQQGPGGGLEPGYGGGGRTLRKDRPASSRGVSPMEEADDIGYGRRG